ncbi:MAG: hypothetical protein O7E54_09290 [Planctomycetota bacterium]|nr:hypothetical protein [Planctomycetota bacterium]
MKRSCFFPLALAALIAAPARADDTLEFATPDGKIRTAEVYSVTKESLEDFKGKGRVAGRRKSLNIPTRLIISFARGSEDDFNQWSKRLAHARSLISQGKLITKGTDVGAEEVLKQIAFSTWKGTPGQEKSERVHPWQNMYAVHLLVKTQYRAGKDGGRPERLDEALKSVEQFLKRTRSKSKRVAWDVPVKGGTDSRKIFAWGSSWLEPEVLLYKARILRAQGKTAEADAAYEDVIKLVKDKKLSPITLTTARMEKAEMDAGDKSSEEAEKLLREAGNWLRGEASRQPDDFSRGWVKRAANQALLRGADLLIESAEKGGGISYDVPLARYRDLRDKYGKDDAALYVGAQTGLGICFFHTDQGEQAYTTLLAVAVRGYDYPDHVQKALFYLGEAAALFAKELDGSGGNGEFLRKAGKQWHADLRERFPQSPWAARTKK